MFQLYRNPYLYDVHLEYIRALMKQGEFVDKIRHARERFSQYFPLTEALWTEWIQEELSYVSTAEEASKVVALFERGVKDYLGALHFLRKDAPTCWVHLLVVPLPSLPTSPTSLLTPASLVSSTWAMAAVCRVHGLALPRTPRYVVAVRNCHSYWASTLHVSPMYPACHAHFSTDFLLPVKDPSEDWTVEYARSTYEKAITAVGSHFTQVQVLVPPAVVNATIGGLRGKTPAHNHPCGSVSSGMQS